MINKVDYRKRIERAEAVVRDVSHSAVYCGDHLVRIVPDRHFRYNLQAGGIDDGERMVLF